MPRPNAARSDAIALALALLIGAGVATTHRDPASPRPVPPSVGRAARIARSGVPVRQAPSLTAPILGTLSRGDRVIVDPTQTSFPGFTQLIRESVDAAGMPFKGELGWVETTDVTFDEAPAQTGTIGGHHSLAETRDLLAVADYRFRAVRAAMEESQTKPAAPAARAALDADWALLSASWSKARGEIARNLTLKGAAFPVIFTADMIPTEDEWVRTLGFVQGQELVRGSLQDVTSRLEPILGRQILFENQPAQNAADLDLSLFKELDTEIRAGEDAAKRASAAAKEAAFSPTGLAIGGTLATIGGAILAVMLLPQIAAGLSLVRRR